mgnify:CR=1 FL=1
MESQIERRSEIKNIIIQGPPTKLMHKNGRFKLSGNLSYGKTDAQKPQPIYDKRPSPLNTKETPIVSL